MSSLWTPEGERPVRRSQETGPRAPAGPTAGHAADAGNRPGTGQSDDDAARELDRLRRELTQVPAAVVVANHAYGLFELAALHLSAQPPHLAEARLAVDALGALVESLGDRLGEAAGSLRDALAQIRLAYVQLSAVGDTPSAPSRAPTSASSPPASS